MMIKWPEVEPRRPNSDCFETGTMLDEDKIFSADVIESVIDDDDRCLLSRDPPPPCDVLIEAA
jgi:hypothetical protein